MKKILLFLIVTIFVAASGCSGGSQSLIGKEKAESIALSHAGTDSDSVSFIRSGLDSDDGRKVYDVSFYLKDGTEYEYEINAVSGKVISVDKDTTNINPFVLDSGTQGGSALLDENEAKSMALKKVPGSTPENIRRFRLETDDGIKVYEGTIIYNKTEYEFEINASTGEILSWEEEPVLY